MTKLLKRHGHIDKQGQIQRDRQNDIPLSDMTYMKRSLTPKVVIFLLIKCYILSNIYIVFIIRRHYIKNDIICANLYDDITRLKWFNSSKERN